MTETRESMEKTGCEFNLLLAATGSVATIKIPLLVKKLKEKFGKNWKKIGDPILHIDLMKWADVLCIAPLDANTMAKLSNGICDNMLCSLCHAWDFKKPILIAPAMNTLMWSHPLTSLHVQTLLSWGYKMIAPISKKLACGDTGVGAMAEVDEIINSIELSMT
ncbi:phosphopantothenoylcysteine decarboxylase-like [Clytia hemisphaerica]|uniref:phosphopantothenoylcysteine decarboxylase-like n=1 Tax=Clytia hemisphaerica TaxID=252671 RepID=UPI0034D42008